MKQRLSWCIIIPNPGRFDRWSKVIVENMCVLKKRDALGTKSTHFSIFYVPYVHVPWALGTHLRPAVPSSPETAGPLSVPFISGLPIKQNRPLLKNLIFAAQPWQQLTSTSASSYIHFPSPILDFYLETTNDVTIDDLFMHSPSPGFKICGRS